MWTAKNRGRYDRSALRYPSDLTDAEWAHVEPLIPPARRGGNKRHVDVREVMNGIMYVLSTGCQWRAIPKDLPPRSTVHDYLDLWSYDGTLDRIHHALYVECREQDEREASPTAAIIDSQCERAVNPPHLWASNFPQFCRGGWPARTFPARWADTIAANAAPLGGREQHGGHTWGAHDDPGTTSAGPDGVGHCPSTWHRSKDRPQIYRSWP